MIDWVVRKIARWAEKKMIESFMSKNLCPSPVLFGPLEVSSWLDEFTSSFVEILVRVIGEQDPFFKVNGRKSSRRACVRVFAVEVPGQVLKEILQVRATYPDIFEVVDFGSDRKVDRRYYPRSKKELEDIAQDMLLGVMKNHLSQMTS